jgi:uncharacterized protein (TIGR01370 family)
MTGRSAGYGSLLAAVVLSVAFGMSSRGQSPAQAAPRPAPVLANVRSFAFSLGTLPSGPVETRRLADHDLVVIDGEDATPAMIATLRRQGAIVLGYLSVGTIEPWRPWHDSLKKYRGAYWPEWDEWYADVSDPGFRRELSRAIAPALLDKGFDGLFLDNTDMVERFPRQAGPMRVLVRQLAALTGKRKKLLLAQNGEPTRHGILRYLDGWNREDVTSTYDHESGRYLRRSEGERRRALDEVRRMARAGLFVTTTDYAGAGDAATRRLAIAGSCEAGAVPYVADIGLTRIPRKPTRCPRP